MEKLRKEREENPVQLDMRKQSAQKRAARERLERVQEALRQLPEVEVKKKKKNAIKPAFLLLTRTPG